MLLSTKCLEDRLAWPGVRGQTCVAGGCKFELVSTTLSNRGILEYMEGEGVGDLNEILKGAFKTKKCSYEYFVVV